MKTSKTRFVAAFLILAFAFQFITNSILGEGIGLFPNNGDWYPGIGSPISWKNTVGSVLFPVKFVMVEPLSFLAQDPDPVPPILLLAFAVYWSLLAMLLFHLGNLAKRVFKPS